MTAAHDASGPEELSGPLLRALREETGLSQNAARKAAGVAQASLSRAERGEARPSPDLVQAVLDLYATDERSSLTSARIQSLVAQARALESEHVDMRVVLQSGSAHHFQWRIGEAERNARLIRSYHGTSIIGPLQTRAVVEAVFTPDDHLDADDAAQAVEARMNRARLVEEPQRQWRFVQNEGALRWPVRGYAEQAAQMDRIAEIAQWPNVSVRVIGLDTVAARPAPVNGFHLYDDDRVLVGTESGSTLIPDPLHRSMYGLLFDELTELALGEDESLELVRDLAGRYRRLGRS